MNGRGLCPTIGLSILVMAIAAWGAEGQIIIDPNLIGWWSFEEGQGSLAMDQSGHGNHATLVGDPQWVPGYDGLALDFDGQGDYIDTGKFPSQLGVADNAARTVALWVYPRSFNGGGVYEMGGHVSAGDGFCLTTDVAENTWCLSYGTSTLIFEGGSVGEWAHITHTNDSWYATAYVNGERVMNMYRRMHTPDEVPFRIGICEGTVFDGLIDDVRLYDRAIEPDEVVRVMAGDPTHAWGPHPAYGSSPTIDLARSLRWSAGTGAVEHDVYLGTDRAAVENAATVTAGIYRGRVPGAQTTYLLPEGALEWQATYYWRVDEIDDEGTVYKGHVWTFTVADALVGWWKFDEGEGTSALDSSGHGNEGTLIGDPQWVPGYDSLALDFDGQDDYIDTGKVPSQLGVDGNMPRTVALWAYTRRFNGGGLYEMGGKDGEDGFSLTTAEQDGQWVVDYGSDREIFPADASGEWTHFLHVHNQYFQWVYVNGEEVAETWSELKTTDDGTFRIGVSGQACFDGLIDDVRLYSRAVTQDEIVRIMQGDPHRAWSPLPAHGSALTLDDANLLQWSAGAGAVAHDVYLGTDGSAVENATTETDGIYQGRTPVETTTRVPLQMPLAWDTTYYWRVDEIGDDGTTAQGPLWRFKTLDYLIIDDFESYSEDLEDENWIWDTWLDGWIIGNGSTVGYFEAPYARMPDPVHGGRQSMPFSYYNVEDPWYSEAVRTWESRQNWTRYGVDTLTLHFIGLPIPFYERADGRIAIGARGRIGGIEDTFDFAWKPLDADGSIIARVDSVAETNADAMAGVMISWSFGRMPMNVALLLTPSKGISFQYRIEDGEPVEQVMRPGPVPPYWLKLSREGSTITAQCSPDGVNWGLVTDDPNASSVEMPAGKAFIGLAVGCPIWDFTSAGFSNVCVTGSDANDWQLEDSDGHYGGNSPEPLYVALVDAQGRRKTVYHPDPLAVGAATWQRWDIPLSAFVAAGLDVTAIQQMIVGVADRDNPIPAGEGTIYFDDFWLTRSTAP